VKKFMPFEKESVLGICKKCGKTLPVIDKKCSECGHWIEINGGKNIFTNCHFATVGMQ
jgi:predicted amidophosphoribosyltransferase